MKPRRGPEFYSQIGRRGGESTKKKYGSEFYSTIGRKGGAATRTDKKAKPPQK
jgi:general stress protein YciG